MPRLVIVGCGDVGLRLLRDQGEVLARHWRVVALARSEVNRARARALGARALAVDLDDRRAVARLRGLAQYWIDFAPTSAVGRRDARTRRLAAMLGARARARSGRPSAIDARWANVDSLPPRIVYASTTGVYGDAAGALFDETRTPAPSNERAYRRLDAEQCLRGLASRGAARVAVLRVPGIYAEQRLPIERLRRGAPALRAEEDGWSNHIHADDLARIAWTALFRGGNSRVFHAVDGSRLRMGDWFDRVADATGLPRPPRLSRAEAQAQVSPTLWSFMRESRRLRADRLVRELRVRLAYPTVDVALERIGAARTGRHASAD